jgi:tRNA(Leu) C34 or U34 (ribose-2'-O)-methylase TrmL
MNRGYFGIGIYHPKTPINLGTLWRSAHNFNASFMFVIGQRYKKQASDTTKAFKHIPLYNYKTFADFMKSRPYDCPLIAIEQSKNSIPLSGFIHPERATYLLGAEDYGIPPRVLSKTQQVIHINTPMCLNVAVAGSIVMFDRQTKEAS